MKKLLNIKQSTALPLVATCLLSSWSISCKSNKNADIVREAFAENKRNEETRYKKDEAKMSNIISVMNEVISITESLKKDDSSATPTQAAQEIESHLDKVTTLLKSMSKNTQLDKDLIAKFNKRKKTFLQSLHSASKHAPIKKIVTKWQNKMNQ